MNNTYINYLKGQQKSTNTIDSYVRYIDECLAFIGKDDSEITYADLIRWQNNFSNLSSATINLRIAAVKSYFKYLRKVGFIAQNPAEEMENVKVNNKVKRYVPASDIQEMVKIISNYRDKAIIMLVASTGLRFSEMQSITLDDYYKAKATDGSIVITGKGNKERKVYISHEVDKYIQNYLATEPYRECENLFVSERGNPINLTVFDRFIKGAAKRAGLPYWEDMSAHWLRVFFATNKNENGVDLKTIQEALGHSDVTTTMRYVKINDTGVKNTMMTDTIFGG